MGKKQIGLAALLVVVLAAPAAAQGGIPWAPTYQRALEQAGRHQRLVLVHFWDDNCPPCKIVERRVFPRPEVSRALSTSFVPVKVNVRANPQLARQFNIHSWPTDVIVDSRGREIFRTVSKQDPNQFVALLDGIAAQHRSHTQQTALAGYQHPSNLPPQSITRGPGGNPQPQFNAVATPRGAGAYPNVAAPTGMPPLGGPGQLGSGGSFQPPAAQPTGTPHGSLPQPAHATSGGSFQPPSGSQSFPNFGAPTIPNRSGIGSQVGQTAGPIPSQPPRRPAPTPRPAVTQHNPHIGATAPAAHVAQRSETIRQPGLPAAAPAAPAADSKRPALDGYCPVTLVEKNRWQEADPKWGIVHRGQLYLFAGAQEQQRFWASPDKYSPVLSGFDPVRFAEGGKLVEGHRQHGVMFRNQIYLFADEAGLEKFWKSPDGYAAAIYQAMQQTTNGNIRR